MAKKASKGACLFCKSSYTGSGMAKHLQSCLPEHLEDRLQKKKGKSQPIFHVMVQGFYSPEYWLHLKISGNARLKDLDQFLRDTWLECCGHMSLFRQGRNELKMGSKLIDVLKPGMELIHEYDFGDTTELLVKVIAQHEGPIKAKNPVEILARNDPPEILCNECGQALAVEICVECQAEGSGWLCESCAREHGCDEEMRLPVVNSPRTGVCGYTG
jgi:hypothetical protein